MFGKWFKNGGNLPKTVGSAVRCKPRAAWEGVTGATPFSCLKIEVVQNFSVVQIDIYFRESNLRQTLNCGEDNPCLFSFADSIFCNSYLEVTSVGFGASPEQKRPGSCRQRRWESGCSACHAFQPFILPDARNFYGNQGDSCTDELLCLFSGL